ncbi:MAG: O-Antigen ligase [bacterium ADurb.Bin243]|nr:MAG: O-Antigen ligase [bacterium ADurb.Bin243]
MLNFRELFIVYISFLFFLLLFYNGGLYDFNNVPVNIALSFIFSSLLLSVFNGDAPSKGRYGLLVRTFLLNSVLFFISSLFSRCIQITYVELIRYLNGLLFFMLIVYCINSKKVLDDFIKVFLVFIQLYILFAFSYYYFTRTSTVGFAGIYSTLFYPYYYATLALTTLPFNLYRMFVTQSSFEKLNCYFLFILQCLSILFTSSRVAQLALITVVSIIFAYAFFREIFRPKVIRLAIIFTLLALVSFSFYTDAFVRLINTLNVEENFDVHDRGGRLNIFKAGWATFMKNPLLGVGTGLSGLFITEHAIVTGNVIDTHNIFLNLLCENGVIYFLIKLSMLFVFIYAWRKTFVQTAKTIADKNIAGELNLLSLCSAVSILALYLQGFSLPHTYLGASLALEFVLFGLFTICVKVSETAFESQTGDREAGLALDFDFTKTDFYFYFVAGFTSVFLMSYIIFDETPSAVVFWIFNMSLVPAIAVMLFKKFSPAFAPKNKFFYIKSLIIIFLAVNSFFAFKVFMAGAYFEEAVALYENEKNSQAFNYCAKSLGNYPNFSSILLISKLYYESEKYHKASEILEYYNSSLPYELFGLHNLAASLLKAGSEERAASKLKEYVAYASNDFGKALSGAFLLKNKGEVTSGVENFAAAAAQTPDFILSRFFVENILAEDEKLDIFMAHFEKLLIDSLNKNIRYSSGITSDFIKAYYNLFRLGVTISSPTAYKFFKRFNRSHRSLIVNLIKKDLKDFCDNFYGRPKPKTKIRKVGRTETDYYIHLGLKNHLPTNILCKVYGIYSPVNAPDLWTSIISKFFMTHKIYRKLLPSML